MTKDVFHHENNVIIILYTEKYMSSKHKKSEYEQNYERLTNLLS